LFFAGENSIFYGNKLLTAENPAADSDVTLLRQLGLQIEEDVKASLS
jgi:biotin synthase